MPDITMCRGEGCATKDECYRFKAAPSDFYQSYFTQEPVNTLTQDCDYFWPVDDHSSFKRELIIARWKPELK